MTTASELFQRLAGYKLELGAMIASGCPFGFLRSVRGSHMAQLAQHLAFTSELKERVRDRERRVAE